MEGLSTGGFPELLPYPFSCLAFGTALSPLAVSPGVVRTASDEVLAPPKMWFCDEGEMEE